MATQNTTSKRKNMVLDQITNAAAYNGLHPLFAEGFRFIVEQAVSAAVGRYELSGGAYALVQEYDTKPLEGAKFEAHRRFIDIQYIVSGEEIMFYAPIDRLQAGEYLPEKDYLALDGKGSPLYVQPGDFAVFYPQDAHLPSRAAAAGPKPVKKVVVKIQVKL
jgi:biofilm protein TabA